MLIVFRKGAKLLRSVITYLRPLNINHGSYHINSRHLTNKRGWVFKCQLNNRKGNCYTQNKPANKCIKQYSLTYMQNNEDVN